MEDLLHSMSIIQIEDKKFKLYIPEKEILKSIQEIAEKINDDLVDKNPLFICILNGAFMFASDLMKAISIPCEITFIKLSSYHGTTTSGKIKEIIGLNEDITKRNIVVIEDIIDTGFTMEFIINSLKSKGANEIQIAALLLKPDALQRDLKIDYAGIKIPNDFIIGYGLDYNGYGRNLRDIYTLISEQ